MGLIELRSIEDNLPDRINDEQQVKAAPLNCQYLGHVSLREADNQSVIISDLVPEQTDRV